jgi:hypothetical protein
MEGKNERTGSRSGTFSANIINNIFRRLLARRFIKNCEDILLTSLNLLTKHLLGIKHVLNYAAAGGLPPYCLSDVGSSADLFQYSHNFFRHEMEREKENWDKTYNRCV